MVSISSSGGAWSTIMTAPMRQMALPSLPRVPKCSLRKYDPSTAPIRTESAPNGVTRIAGAKAYAAKLQTSPTTTIPGCQPIARAVRRDVNHVGHTCCDTGPPDGTLQIYKAVAFKTVSFFRLHQTLWSKWC